LPLSTLVLLIYGAFVEAVITSGRESIAATYNRGLKRLEVSRAQANRLIG
jgi:hypothetical protein